MVKEIQNTLILNIDEFVRRNISGILPLASFFYGIDKVHDTKVHSPIIFELLQSCLVKSQFAENEKYSIQVATLLLHLSEQSIFEIDGLDDLMDGFDKVIAKNLSSIQKNSFKNEIFYNYVIQRSRVLNLPASNFGNIKKSFVKSKISIVSSQLFGWASNPGLQKYNDTRLCDQVITFLSRGNSSNIEQLSVISNIDELILFYITSYRICSSALSSAVLMNILLLGLIKIANNLSVHDKEFFNVMIMTLIKEESMMYGLQLEVENV